MLNRLRGSKTRKHYIRFPETSHRFAQNYMKKRARVYIPISDKPLVFGMTKRDRTKNGHDELKKLTCTNSLIIVKKLSFCQSSLCLGLVSALRPYSPPEPKDFDFSQDDEVLKIWYPTT
jgi:hypothetical protein